MGKKSSKKLAQGSEKSSRVIDDGVDQDEWVEATPSTFSAVHSIPTSQSLAIKTSHVATTRPDYKSAVPKDTYGSFSVRGGRGLQELSKDQYTDGYGADASESLSMSANTKSDFDLFSDMGSERKKVVKDVPDPDKPKMSSLELNKDYFASRKAATGASTAYKKVDFGSSGSAWRMKKLQRAYEAAEEEGRDVQEVARERYDTEEAWQDALDERRFLDEKANPALKDHREQEERVANGDEPQVDEFGREIRADRQPSSQSKATPTKFLFSGLDSPSLSDGSRPPSRSAFRRPGTSADVMDSPSSMTAQQGSRPSSRFGTPKPSTPVPSVFTPPIVSRNSSSLRHAEMAAEPEGAQPVMARSLSPTSLNRLQAKVLKAKLMDPNSQATRDLEREYEAEAAKARQAPAHSADALMVGEDGRTQEVRVLPTLDGRGRLYDVGLAGTASDAKAANHKRKRCGERSFESHDEQGKIVRYNADDDDQTLEDLVRQEKFGAGAAELKSLDAELASRIGTDSGFQNDLEYMDDAAERLARKKMKTADQKRLFAIQDFAKTKKALDTCIYCYQDTDDTSYPPQVPIIALGTRAYLALSRYEGLVDEHCYIVPLQHCLTSLEADDDTWEEIRNFMKTLTQMFAHQEKGVVFFETVLNLKWQKHTVIEAVPLPWNLCDDCPAYFREGILTAESEWSTNKRLIDFAKRPGGFRRSMVPDLPYFMVQFDYKGDKGFGHVIEGFDGVQGGDEGHDLDELEKSGGKFERFFAAEIIGSLLEVEPRRWRRPRRMDVALDDARAQTFKKTYDKFDWTKMLKVQ